MCEIKIYLTIIKLKLVTLTLGISHSRKLVECATYYVDTLDIIGSMDKAGYAPNKGYRTRLWRSARFRTTVQIIAMRMVHEAQADLARGAGTIARVNAAKTVLKRVMESLPPVNGDKPSKAEKPCEPKGLW
jgi:hypothetical protein